MPADIRPWLVAMKQLLLDGGQFVIWGRDKNQQGMLGCGLNTQGLKLQLCQLTAADLVWGPGPDDDPGRPGDVAVFAPVVGDPGQTMYVKVKVVSSRGVPVRVECLSFHPLERPIRRR